MSAQPGIDYTKKIDLITEEVLQEMEELYALGMHDRHIYDYFMIPARTFQWWKMRGRQVEKLLMEGKEVETYDEKGNLTKEIVEITEDEITQEEKTYLRILHISKKGRAQLVKRNLQVIEDAGKDGTWQASAWKLERTDPAFRKREVIKHTGKIKISDEKKKKLDKIFEEEK